MAEKLKKNNIKKTSRLRRNSSKKQPQVLGHVQEQQDMKEEAEFYLEPFTGPTLPRRTYPANKHQAPLEGGKDCGTGALCLC